MLTYISLFSLLGSAGSLIGGGILLASPGLHDRLRTPLLSYAVGALLGAVFMGLLPESISSAGVGPASATVLAGFVLFFVLEKVLRIPHRHAHSDHGGQPEQQHADLQPAASLILVGDAFHNFVDGILIATAFGVSIPLGVTTALAVVAHEIPQEVGDFVILVEGGMDRVRAFVLNLLTGLMTFAGALATYLFRDAVQPVVPYILALSAASFLYIATVDVAPMLHHYMGFRSGFKQTFGLVVGILTIAFLHRLLG